MDLCAVCGRAPVAPGDHCPACGALADGDPSFAGPRRASDGISFAPGPIDQLELVSEAGGWADIPPAAPVPAVGAVPSLPDLDLELPLGPAPNTVASDAAAQAAARKRTQLGVAPPIGAPLAPAPVAERGSAPPALPSLLPAAPPVAPSASRLAAAQAAHAAQVAQAAQVARASAGRVAAAAALPPLELAPPSGRMPSAAAAPPPSGRIPGAGATASAGRVPNAQVASAGRVPSAAAVASAGRLPAASPTAPGRVPSGPAAIAATPSRAQLPPNYPQFGGQEFDDAFDDDGPDVKIEVDASKRAQAQVTTRRNPAQPAQPKPVPVDPDAIHVDPYELQVFADFGPVPKSIVQAPPYAIRVLQRLRELRRSLEAARAGEAKAGEGVTDALVMLFEPLRPALEHDREGAAMLAPLLQIEERARARGQALESTSAEFAREVGKIDVEIAGIQTTMSGEAQVAERLAAEVAQREELLGRMEARLKRTEIEIRSTQDAARAAAGPEATVAPPEYASKLATLAAERQERLGDVGRLKEYVEDARVPYRAQQKVLSELQRKISDLQKKRKSLEDGYQRQLSVRSEGVAEVERERRAAIVEMARRLLGGMRGIDVSDGARDAVALAERAHRDAKVQLEKNVRALDSYDREQVKRGLVVIGVAAALVLALLVAFFAMITAAPAK